MTQETKFTAIGLRFAHKEKGDRVVRIFEMIKEVDQDRWEQLVKEPLDGTKRYSWSRQYCWPHENLIGKELSKEVGYAWSKREALQKFGKVA